jgi:hypothetical protein
MALSLVVAKMQPYLSVLPLALLTIPFRSHCSYMYAHVMHPRIHVKVHHVVSLVF